MDMLKFMQRIVYKQQFQETVGYYPQFNKNKILLNDFIHTCI